MRLAAVACWLVAGCGYLLLEVVAALRFGHHYGYGSNMISDLGRPGLSSSAPVMNAAFVLQGSLFLAAAVLVILALRPARNGTAFICFAATNALGNLVVATIHSGPGGLQWLHVVGAVFAIVAGNAAILAGFPIVDGAGWYRTLSRGLAILGLIAFAALAAQTLTGAVSVLPDAVWERVSVYTITLWQLISAVRLLRTRASALDRTARNA